MGERKGRKEGEMKGTGGTGPLSQIPGSAPETVAFLAEYLFIHIIVEFVVETDGRLKLLNILPAN